MIKRASASCCWGWLLLQRLLRGMVHPVEEVPSLVHLEVSEGSGGIHCTTRLWHCKHEKDTK